VDGRFRGAIKRDLALVKNKTANTFIQLLNNKDTLVRLSSVKAINKLGISQGNAMLLALLKNDKNAEVKVEALKALASMPNQFIGQAIKIALTGKDKSVRVAGIDLIGNMNIPKPLMVTLLSDVINTKTTEEKQAALLTLGHLPVEHTNKVFDDLLNQMANGKVSPDLYFELGEAIDSTRSPQLITRYKSATSKLSKDDLTASFAGSLYGGDANRGRNIFFTNQSAQCIRCHSYDDMGGNAGPRLNGVATRLPRPKLLEALINPSARLAPGFGVVTVELKERKTIAGVLLDENDKSLTIKVSDKQNEVIAKDKVMKRTNAASSMPEMRYILSKKEIRDVVSFLSGLK
jgi:putative heme-binding domain-containing protein